ncbi:bacillithiol biosynthesis cysteine-adding enzyme BshC [Catalinimonas alkaloidigena]|uniref:bacillithiol biosynthesis cysteine-adding enzyme BshC n=1 Tax=Catalinimonas alkaloidigena TaxID=1075417 RepID=UPI0024059D8F|nr:bacillithiol biosynthesis cysteine-adding enzyme BshC [Catalinimonas alkaloidigena]MDF9800744.1 bacillithiol biosynthesis cysteine-adding enzyme BshC [Catalinimonas alkaloidigena]
MNIEKLNLSETGTFSPIFLDYINNKDTLQKFHSRRPDLKSFEKQLQEKTFSQASRQRLQAVLRKQYTSVAQPTEVTQNIEKLGDSKTFTVTTGHQLNIFTGPLYFIYKIVTTINCCKQLNEAYPEYHFVPVYWMASEDHDFEEINHFHLFGNDYSWRTDQKGAVGRFTTENIQAILDELPGKVEVFNKAYKQHKYLADAVRCYVNELFGKHGLLVLDADHAELKADFRSVMKDDLVNHSAKKYVEACSKELNELDYKTQVFPREINLFYLDEQLRERIEKIGDSFVVLNSELKFSEAGLMEALERHPEKFSPNVILRPLYQETILPNLAYVGGPSELAYWLQLKSMFEYYQLPFPILLPRNFGLVINKSNERKLNKVPIQTKDLFLDSQSLIRKFVEANAENSLSLNEEQQEISKVFDAIRSKAIDVDKSLEGLVGKEEKNTLKILHNIEKRLKKSEEQNQEIHVKQLESLKDKLFPDGSLQERKENFLNFYINNPAFLDEVLEHFDPLEFCFYILHEEADES